jgi:integrase/recombinase XerD
MSHKQYGPASASLHPPNCEIVTKMLNFGGWLIDVRTIAAKSVRLELQRCILGYVEAVGIAGDAKEKQLFRAGINGQAKRLTGQPLTSVRICSLVKRRLKNAGLPSRLSPHSFRVTGITDLLAQGVPLEDVQYLAGHAEPRTTGLYDRRKKQVTRSIVERISI